MQLFSRNALGRNVLTALSIRTRITIGTVLLAVLFFGAVGLVVREQVDVILQGAAVEVLSSDAAPFETAIEQELSDPIDNPGEGQLVAVLDPSGATQTSTLPANLTANFALIDLTDTTPQQVVIGAAHYLVAVESVSSGTGDWTIVAAYDQDASALVLADLTTGLFVGLGALTVLFGAVSWLLTGAALRPVTHLRRSAETIRQTGSDELLPIGVERDEITALAITLNHLINDLRASAARERQLVSDASHELRTPLAVLQAQLELLRTGDRATLDSDILAAERAAARLTHLVNSLLDLSRLEADNPPAPANIGWLLDEAGEAIDRARLQAVSDDVKIDLTVSGPATALGDVLMPRLVYGRVLNNLLSNALHACDGRGHIIVTIEHGSMSFITVVTDDGAGIPAEFLPHAFDRFSQGDASPGAGLGLAIVAAAVAAAGGTVTIENTVPSGLDVTITLPVIHEL